MSSIVLGIAALVAINSFNYNLVRDIDQQTASLIGADLRLSSNQKIQDDTRALTKQLPGSTAEQWDLLTMAYFPKVDAGQFVRVRASSGEFPFYGKVVSHPAEAADLYKENQTALVDESLMESLGLTINDSIKLGSLKFKISGSLSSTDGGAGVGSSFAPGVRISLDQLQKTGLVREGSLVNYAIYKKSSAEDIATWLNKNKEQLKSSNIQIESVEDRKEQLSEAFSYLNQFLNLVAMVALILGSIGVATSIFIYMRRKEPVIAILRCLGMTSGEVSLVFYLQILVWGIISVFIGAFLGSLIQYALPILFAGVLPYQVDFQISPLAILEGVSIGVLLTAIFCAMPLAGIKKVTAIRALRPSFGQVRSNISIQAVSLVFLVVLVLWGFLLYLTESVLTSAYFILGLAASFGILYLLSRFFVWLIRRFFPRKMSFVFRQGLANLFRPQNRTSLLTMSIGMGVAIIGVLIIIQSLLLHNVASMGKGEQPNVVLYGVESNQLSPLQKMTDSLDMPVIQSVPVVTVELSGWKGKSKTDWKKDTTAELEDWVTRRETRVSYRDSLESNEELVEGVFPIPFTGDSIYISLGEGYAEGLGVSLGDEVVFDVQGVRMKTYVGSIRSIDFANLQARFFILFPEGVLEKAPQFHVVVSKTSGAKETARYRNLVAGRFPNVSVVDLSSILKAVTDILSKVTYVIKFMAGFSILTGFIVLFSSLLLSKFQRMKDGVLLRTLGASRKSILWINAIEYAFIGFFASFVGIMISLLLAYLLSRYQFGLEFNVNLLSLLFVWITVTVATTLVGVYASIDVIKSSPLKALRKI